MKFKKCKIVLRDSIDSQSHISSLSRLVDAELVLDGKNYIIYKIDFPPYLTVIKTIELDLVELK